MKKITLFMLACMSLSTSHVLAQDNVKPAAERNGFKIHAMYVSALMSIPVGGLRQFVPSTGAGFKWGSIFYFYKPGIANRLINFGLQTQYLNAEGNVRLSKIDENDVPYTINIAANLGPVVTVKPSNDIQADIYYMLGTGVRLFPNQDEYIYARYATPGDAHTRFTQSIGLGFHYKALYSTIGLQMLNYKYTILKDGTFTNVNHFTTFQFSVGVCGWRVK